MDTSQPKLYTVGEVGEILGISTRKVWKLIEQKLLAAVRVGLRGTRVRAEDLTEYVSSLPAAR
jgi:excisionase family DNA binding protein